MYQSNYNKIIASFVAKRLLEMLHLLQSERAGGGFMYDVLVLQLISNNTYNFCFLYYYLLLNILLLLIFYIFLLFYYENLNYFVIINNN